MGVTMHPAAGSGWDKWDKAGFRVDVIGGCGVVAAYGEVDLDTAVGLHRAVHTALRFSSHLIIDLTQVSFIDSSGLGVLVGARRKTNALGGAVSLVHPPLSVQRILVGTQLQQAFPLFGSLDEALQECRTA
jgi:anti-sigma B factor antagonist